MTINPRPTAAFSPYAVYPREDWAELRADTPMPLTDAELENLSGLIERISVQEVIEIYLPLSRLLNLYVEAVQGLHSVTEKFLRKGNSKMPFIIGLAGSVAAGKSTTARVLQALLARWPSHPHVELVPTDGFLFPNAVLETRALMQRKGFPESYDLARLLAFLAQVKSGKDGVKAPRYSHLIYDVLPDQTLEIGQPDIVIIEGLNVLQPADDAEGRRGHSLRIGFLRFLDLYRRGGRAGGKLVYGTLPAPAADRVPRPRLVLPPLFHAVGGGGGRDRAFDLALDQSRQSDGEHPADAPARRSHPAQGRRTTRSRRWR